MYAIMCLMSWENTAIAACALELMNIVHKAYMWLINKIIKDATQAGGNAVALGDK